MSTTILPKGAHIHRFRQIAEVLARHGLGYLHSALGLERLVPSLILCRSLRLPSAKRMPQHCPPALKKMRLAKMM